MEHRFGGLWTREKLAVLEKYLQFYAKALQGQPFTLHYVDAFAGTGSQDPKLVDAQEVMIPFEDLKGSVTTALEVEPGFDHYHFNDMDQSHIEALLEIKSQYKRKSIKITKSDANSFVPDFCRSLRRHDRAVLFLDPYSTQLNWETLNYVAQTGKVDLWLLFPISIIARMTPRDGARIIPEWNDTLTRLLGTNDWINDFYKPKVKPPIDDLFGESETPDEMERINVMELEMWVTNRLKELFPYVATPYTLYNNGRPLFTFYFAVSNQKKTAWRLADRAVRYILKN